MPPPSVRVVKWKKPKMLFKTLKNKPLRVLFREGGGGGVKHLNPSSPNSDKHLISPYNITSWSNIQVMRIKEMIIRLEMSAWHSSSKLRDTVPWNSVLETPFLSQQNNCVFLFQAVLLVRHHMYFAILDLLPKMQLIDKHDIMAWFQCFVTKQKDIPMFALFWMPCVANVIS